MRQLLYSKWGFQEKYPDPKVGECIKMGTSQSMHQSQALGMGRLREDRKIYQIVDMHGDGQIVQYLRYAITSGDTSFLEGYLETKFPDFMYNQGKGKVVTVTELVKIRNKERNERLSAFLRKKGKGKSGPNVLDDFNQEGENVGDLKKALKLLDGGGGGKGKKQESKYKDVIWKLDERGSMGETIVGICLLQSSEIHNRLVHEILKLYPKLVNDMNVSEDFYGLTPLHQAIINQDIQMVYSLLKLGANVNARCYGAFFCAEDQKTSRTDSLEHEYVELSTKTNYTGSMYFGEYPLSFAACMNQVDCYRLLLKKKANPNDQDSNGNTVLHMCVIHENMEMFRVALETGAKLNMTNKQNLTPLTLAAKMGKKMMFREILEIEGDRVWGYGNSSSTAYPLAKIDTINENTGELNDTSALSLVVYGETNDHLDLLDGLLESVIEEKWNAYGQRKILISLLSFIVHWGVLTLAFFLRPVPWTTQSITDGWIDREGNAVSGYLGTPETPVLQSNGDYVNMPWKPEMNQCHLRDYWNQDETLWPNNLIRGVAEAFIVLSVLVQIILDVQDIRHIGWQKWWRILQAFPAKIAYKISYIFIFLMIPMRAGCGIGGWLLVIDNILACITMLLTTLHFLFFCRAVPFIGPFVLMIYRIIATDIRRFIVIYGIFLVGFSQAFYIIFLTCERETKFILMPIPNNMSKTFTWEQYLRDYGGKQIMGKDISQEQFERAKVFENVIQNPLESFIRTFILTIGEFTVLYRNLAMCPANIMIWVGKTLFMIFEMGVSILQFNMLIAMLTRTYEAIFRTKKEYKRQWAQVILMLEVSLSPKDRLNNLLKYSRPTGTNKRVRSLVVSTRSTDADKTSEEMDRKRKEKAQNLIDEKKALYKRRLKDLEQKEGIRPVTSFRTPRPVTTMNK